MPFRFQVTNTTPSETISLGVQLTVIGAGVELVNSHGSDSVDAGATFNAVWDESEPTGDSRSQAAFIRVRDYYSPAHSDGDAAALDAVRVGAESTSTDVVNRRGQEGARGRRSEWPGEFRSGHAEFAPGRFLHLGPYSEVMVFRVPQG